ncbi:hypothetical protein BKP45_06225 [Anaerobacillus alkalidiazotrophicus]|uniref:HDOD domain-containing protein n=1 Tax=Anaerobacillus alkalidiazotrophicus TaxID=472963 RepID=A0A1S2MEF1_9BACI|nr:EAL domain-containing protein [Anaerobacillus alkalidiazotrophicus]OIJ22237.1 hypothetical protein BKP45_06225 [Anaerobacillus alkalidiazotrophicus]
MEIFVARQPILTKTEEVIGYELLYRNSHNNTFTKIDGDGATIELLLNSFIGIGNKKISSGKKLFINFTRNLLIKRVPLLLSPEKIIIEILEDVEGDAEIIDAISEFKQLGYTIALDDFLLKDINKSLITYADIIKVDFRQTSYAQRKIIQNIAQFNNITLLAEKVETRAEFNRALKEGYALFQGYFFSKPVILSTQDVPFYTNDYLDLLYELHSPEPCIDNLTAIIECDLSLSYKILKIVNTMDYYTRIKITSIKQAILTLGINELINLIAIISLSKQIDSSAVSNELLLRSLTRAKLCESLGDMLFGTKKKSECFMLGMFSLLDVILKQPLEKTLEALPLSDDIKYALLGYQSPYKLLLDLIVAIEKADWNQLKLIAPKNLSKHYEDAILWATKINSNIDNEYDSAKAFSK